MENRICDILVSIHLNFYAISFKIETDLFLASSNKYATHLTIPFGWTNIFTQDKWQKRETV